MLISLQLHTYGGQGWISCISGGTYFRLSGGFSSEGLYRWVGLEKKDDFSFWIEICDWGVSFCFAVATIEYSFSLIK